ncbi:MAG: hypothetical protein R2854_23220 [Caldilineaceae bacterium]
MTTLESRNRYLADGRRNSIIENLGTALLSLILALIVWIIATNETNPIVQGTYDRAIPVTVRPGRHAGTGAGSPAGAR